MRKRRWHRIASLAGASFLCVWLPTRGFALDPARSVFQFHCQNWTRQNGLPADKINTIIQTKDGYIWLGTQNGLVRFDGLGFKVIPIDLPQGKGQEVRALSRSRNGGIWFAINSGGFGSYDGQMFSAIGDDRWSKPGMSATTIMEARDGALWMGDDLGLGRRVKGKPEESLFDETTTGPVLSICEDPSGRIWLGTAEHGLFYWAGGKFVQFPDDLLKKRNIYALAVDAENQIWVGTENGLLCYSNGHVKEVPFLYNEVKALLVDSHGILWVGTTGMGLARFQNGVFTYLRKVDGLGSDRVTSLFEDAEASLWVGTRDGLSQLTDLKFPIYSSKEGICEGSSHSVFASGKGGLWITTDTGVSYFDGKTATNYTQQSLLPQSYIKLGFEARNGDVYLVDGDKNIAVISGNRLLARYTNQIWPSAIAEDSEGVLVAAGTGESLFRVQAGTLRPYEYKGGGRPDYYWIYNLCISKDGAIWVASKNGIFRLKDGHFKQWSILDGLSDTKTVWICQDVDASIWAGSAKGITRIKDDKLKNIKQENGLYEETIFAIVPDDRGAFWFSSGRGIFRASRQSLNDFADGKTTRIQSEVFAGLESVKFTDRTDQEYSGCKTLDGRIWFPSPWGVVMIDPAHIPTNQIAPPVHIDRVLVNGHEVTRSDRIVMPLGKGEMEFDFTALSFIAPQKVRFRYQLEGYDKDWVETRDQRKDYTNLKPGSYTFRVIAANADGVWNQTGDSLKLELLPHFYQTVWFYLFCGALTFAALGGIYLCRVRLLTHKQQALQKARDLFEVKVQERTSELRNEIEERKRAEETIASERRLLRTLIDLLPETFYVKDLDSRFLVANAALAKLLGKDTPSQVLGLSDADLYPAGLAAEFRAEEMKVFAGEPLLSQENTMVSLDGREHTVLTTKLPFRDSQGRICGLVGIGHDITERKRLETQLFQSQKMETVGKLAGGIAHEFNGILTAIIGQSELLLGDLPAGSPLAQNATEISLAAGRAATLTRQLLAYGRKQILQPEALNLNHVLASMEGMLDHLMGGDVDTHIVPAPGLHAVKADAGQIEQVIMNMVINARDAMPHGGKLTLETANVTVDQESAGRYPELKPGDYVMLAITDTGAGMSEEVKARLFEPFFTTKGVGQGTGLGLSTCYGIIKQSGGHISVSSEPARGASFKIYLPRAPKHTQIPIPRLDSPDLPRGTETILLVEDDPALRGMAATLLRRLGYTVLPAANGIEALRLGEQRDIGQVDLLFTNVVMPHMSGRKLADRVAKLFPRARILFASGYTENAVVLQGVLNQGVALLQKPFTPSALARKVREVLDQPGVPKPDPAQKTPAFTKITDGVNTP